MKTRRFLGLALAACMLGSAAPLGASAAEYNVLYDVNRDGTVSITDTIFLSRYLTGSYSVSTPSNLDVNQNLVVDAVDAWMLQTYLVGNRFECVEYDVLGN